MKALLYLLSLLFMLLVSGCQSTENQMTPPTKDQISRTLVTEKWKLTEVVYTSMVAGKANSSTPPPYEEILELKADSTFRRYRSTGYEATGTYTFKQYGADDYGFIATFNNKTLSYHDMPGYRQYSHAEGQVYFRKQGENKLVESYIAADGPSFVYGKVTNQD